ncbi:MAG: hypothetical protein ACOYD4_05815 [Solirubrobacterales bacterium]
MHLCRRAELEPYLTKDGSTIREWAGPGCSPAANQSLAEATVAAGDCAVIAPGEAHQLRNTGEAELVVICAGSPAYSHEDTVLWD